MSKEVKIKNENDFVKDLTNNAILNNNIKSLNLYKLKKRKRQQEQQEINNLKEKISQLEEIISKLIKE